jgi:hypothetical protein
MRRGARLPIRLGVGPYKKAQVLPTVSLDLHVVRRAICTKQNIFSLSEKGKKGKIFHKKELPENVVAGRNVVCDRRTATQAQRVARLASRS